MASDDASIYASLPFKFVIDSNPYYVHADLISKVSKPLDRMINGKMAEAKQGYAVLEDVDEGTFIRFSDWAYKGYYTAARYSIELQVISEEGNEPKQSVPIDLAFEEPQQALESPEAMTELADSTNSSPTPEAVTTITETWSGWEPQEPKKKKKVRHVPPATVFEKKSYSRFQLKESFLERSHTVLKRSLSIPACRQNRNASEDYTDVFLSHARVYVFAEKYDIRKLQTLALESLQYTLAIFDLYPERTGDIVELLRYVYAETGSHREGEEDMRSLMTHYIGYEMDTLMIDPEFQGLMVEDGGDLLGDFVGMVMKRVNEDDSD